jgi:hypothetical protein
VAKTYDFDDFLREARPTAFILRVSEEQTITIEPPNSETMLLLDEASTARRQLELLCGDQWQAVFALVREKHTGVLNALAMKLMKHFGVDQAVSGGGRAS